MRRSLLRGSITVRITAGFVCAMAILLALSAVFIYKRMETTLDRQARDIPNATAAERAERAAHDDETLEQLFGQLAIAYGIALALSAVVGHRVARAALDPVEDMRRRAASGSQDASVRLEVGPGDDELARLASTLNELLERIQAGVAREQRLIADASHELRTPLGLMLMQLDLALSRERSPAETRVALERLRAETERLIRLANDLLLLARADEGRLPSRIEPVVVADLLEAARARFAGHHPDLVVDAPAGLEVLADGDRLAQALDNMIDNAVRHGGGRVELRAEAADGVVTVHVRDHGPGFSADLEGRAFDRFVTGSQGRSGSSTGLGLTIVAAVAEALGGRAGARPAADGAGADVWLTLPAASPSTIGQPVSSSVHDADP
jgi:signal transduction histidine kinase